MSSFDLGIDPPTAPQVGGGTDPDGAVFEPADAFDAPPMLEEHLAPEVDEADVRRGVRHIGRTLNRARRRPEAPDLWLVLPEEEEGIAPPLTRLINRSDRMRRLCQHLDPMFLGLAVSEYVARNLEESHQARLAARDRGVPTTDGDQHRQDPAPDPDDHDDAHPAPRHDPVVGWGAGVAPEEVAGLGVFQG